MIAQFHDIYNVSDCFSSFGTLFKLYSIFIIDSY